MLNLGSPRPTYDDKNLREASVKSGVPYGRLQSSLQLLMQCERTRGFAWTFPQGNLASGTAEVYSLYGPVWFDEV